MGLIREREAVRLVGTVVSTSTPIKEINKICRRLPVFMAKPICPISHFPFPVQEPRYVIIPNQTGRDAGTVVQDRSSLKIFLKINLTFVETYLIYMGER